MSDMSRLHMLQDKIDPNYQLPDPITDINPTVFKFLYPTFKSELQQTLLSNLVSAFNQFLDSDLKLMNGDLSEEEAAACKATKESAGLAYEQLQ